MTAAAAQPLVSIIVLTRNNPRELDDTLTSIHSQRVAASLPRPCRPSNWCAITRPQLGFPVHDTGHLHDDLSLRALCNPTPAAWPRPPPLR